MHTKKLGFRERFLGSVKTKAQKQLENSIRENNRALFNIETTLKAKDLLKIKIGFFKYKKKDPYTNTIILAKGLGNLGSGVVSNIITFAGFCDSPIDLTYVIPTSSKEIRREKESRDLSPESETSNLAVLMNSSCNIS